MSSRDFYFNVLDVRRLPLFSSPEALFGVLLTSVL
jgi:hypothetical protein